MTEQLARYVSVEASEARGGRVRGAGLCMIMGVVAAIAMTLMANSTGIEELATVGLVMLAGCFVYGLVVMVTGRPGFSRTAQCPNCGTHLKWDRQLSKGIKCPGCKDRLLYRDERLYNLDMPQEGASS